MTQQASTAVKGSRREELLAIAAGLFAERGFKNTTVRDIADTAGILSGSLYHHFDSKESMVDEILSTFQAELFRKYDEVLGSDLDARAKFEEVIRLSFDAIHNHHAEVAIYQNDAGYLAGFERFGYLNERNAQLRRLWIGLLEEGVAAGTFRPDIEPEVVYRFIRDTVWVAVRWYRPGGELTAEQVAEQYLRILLDGISARRRPVKAKS
jgi:AcrR family transcriptional regulator